MLSFEVLRNHEGLQLLGSSDTLRGFHAILHDVNERSPLIQDKEGFFLALAYDVRKAYEGQRKKRKPDPHHPHTGPLLGVDILWPTLLVQCRMLRASLGFIDTTKRHQAYAYALEAVVEEGLAADFGTYYNAIHEQYLMLSPEHPSLEENIVSRVQLYHKWSKAQRQRQIVNLLESLDPLYSFMYTMRTKGGETGLLSPEELDKSKDEETV